VNSNIFNFSDIYYYPSISPSSNYLNTTDDDFIPKRSVTIDEQTEGFPVSSVLEAAIAASTVIGVFALIFQT
jgi:hypothetical protein